MKTISYKMKKQICLFFQSKFWEKEFFKKKEINFENNWILFFFVLRKPRIETGKIIMNSLKTFNFVQLRLALTPIMSYRTCF